MNQNKNWYLATKKKRKTHKRVKEGYRHEGFDRKTGICKAEGVYIAPRVNKCMHYQYVENMSEKIKPGSPCFRRL